MRFQRWRLTIRDVVRFDRNGSDPRNAGIGIVGFTTRNPAGVDFVSYSTAIRTPIAAEIVHGTKGSIRAVAHGGPAGRRWPLSAVRKCEWHSK